MLAGGGFDQNREMRRRYHGIDGAPSGAPGNLGTPIRLAAEAGASPVTHASGKSRGVVFRWACNHRLRAAITCFADNSRHASPWAADVYRRARARGCDHPHAIRILARAWIRVLWRAWTDGALYHPALHNAAVAHNALAA